MNEREKLEESWEKIKKYIRETRPDLWDENLECAVKTVLFEY